MTETESNLNEKIFYLGTKCAVRPNGVFQGKRKLDTARNTRYAKFMVHLYTVRNKLVTAQ